MQVQIRDAAAFRSISPTMLQAYLETKGWVRQEIWRSGLVVWALEHNNGSQEILAPLHELSYRYAVRISEVVETLSELEERSQLDVYCDLMGAGADVIRIRAFNVNGTSGLFIADTASFLEKTNDLLLAAARAAEHPRRQVYRGRLSQTVSDYLRGVQLLPGYGMGYDLTLHSRIPAGYGIQEDLGDSFIAPFARRATVALNNGLREARKTSDAVLGREAEISAFGDAAQQGVSANLCEAIAALSNNERGIKISMAWAPVRYSNESGSEFVFTKSDAEVFYAGSEWLRRRSPLLDVHITGEIVQLDRESQENYDGQAVVLYLLDRRPVALQVQFDMADRDEVIRAFKDGRQVSLDGDIYREGRRYILRAPRNFFVDP